MIPGKKYKPEDFLQIAWRRRWLLVVPLAVCLLGSTLYAFSLPQRWMSTALIQVVPQRVPESYVRSTVTLRVEDRLDSIKQMILSRTKLESLITEFNLYPQARQAGLMEDVVEKMRNDVSMTGINRADAFRISYVSDNPRTAMRVTERLAGLFITENLKDRELLAESSSQFLERELEQTRLQLEETEKKLANYRRQYAGQLPDQVQTNLQAVTNSQLQIQQLAESINRDRDQLMLMQRQLGDTTTSDTAPVVDASGNIDPTQVTGGSAAQRLESARNTLRGLELRFKPEHPDIIRLKRVVAELETKADQEALQQPVSSTPVPTRLTAAEVVRGNRTRDLQNDITKMQRQIAGKEREEQRLRNISSQYQFRVEAAPTRESELTALVRDYDTISKQYQSLLTKHGEARMAANLERQQGGEQFRLLDPARTPERPVNSRRTEMIVMGLVAGLGIGLGIVGLLEYRDRSLRSEEDVMLALALPVLAVIPRMTSRAERRGERRRRLMYSTAGVVTLVGAAAVFVWKFVQWREFLPW